MIKMKKVNIYPTTPIYSLNPVVRGVVCNVTKSVSDIRKCLIAKARVEEILSNGTTVQLNLFNYDKDNNSSEVANETPATTFVSNEPVKVAKAETKVVKVDTEVKEDIVEDKEEEVETTDTEEVVEADEAESSEEVDDEDDDDKYGFV